MVINRGQSCSARLALLCFKRQGTMKLFTYALMLTFLLILTPGCTGDKERGINRPNQKKDLPRAAPPTDSKK